jgi:hypothetical protein
MRFDRKNTEFCGGLGPSVETSAWTGVGVDEACRKIAHLHRVYPFSLLWRGNKDGFRSRDFHQRCDGKSPTLALIRDTGRNIFDGFIRALWVSPLCRRLHEDSSLESFLFTAKSPHNLVGRTFPRSEFRGCCDEVRHSAMTIL